MKILGLDLGSNSIGWAVRNTTLPENQLEKYGVITFSKGVGTEKGIEYSFAAERTKNRSLRTRYQAHKYEGWTEEDCFKCKRTKVESKSQQRKPPAICVALHS